MTRPFLSRRAASLTALGSAAGGAVLLIPHTPAFGEIAASPLAQGTSPQPTSAPPSAERPVRFYPVDAQFMAYYAQVDGPRTLGGAISPITMTVDGVPAQYFEKARLENRTTTNRSGNPALNFEFGLLVDEMKAARSLRPVGGERSTISCQHTPRTEPPTAAAHEASAMSSTEPRSRRVVLHDLRSPVTAIIGFPT